MPTASKVSKFDDLKILKVGVQTGTTGDEAASKLLGKTNANIKRFESTPMASSRQSPTPRSPPSSTAWPGKKATLKAKLDQGLAGIKSDGSYNKR